MRVTHIRFCASVALTAALAVVMGSAPAHAAGSTRLYASNDGVYGIGDVRYESTDVVRPIDLYVWDRACDSSSVYVHFLVYAGRGVWPTTKRRNFNGCRGAVEEWHDLHIHDGSGIYAVQLVACVDSAGGDECGRSPLAENPHLDYPDAALRILVERGGTLPGPDGVHRSEGVG